MNDSNNDEIDDRIKSKYVHICEQLDIDETIVNSTWDSFRTIRNDHTLEVNLYENSIELNLVRITLHSD